jgi:hypothetical protein
MGHECLSHHTTNDNDQTELTNMDMQEHGIRLDALQVAPSTPA